MGKGRNLGGNNFSKTDPKHKDYWATPQYAVDGLMQYCENKGLVPENLPRLDVCASELNSKCDFYIDEEMDTLVTEWGSNQLCWLNPPYSKVRPFLEKAVSETTQGNYTIALLKNDSSTKWFDYAINHATAVIFVTLGRIGFVSAIDCKAVGGNNFSSVAFVFGPKEDDHKLITKYVSLAEIKELGGVE